jgi:hypothetical protein
MTQVLDETLMRAAFAAARTLEPTDAEVAAVLARADPAHRKRSAAPWRPGLRPRRAVHGRAFARRLAPIGAALILVFGGGYAVAEPVRAAIDDVAGTFSDWLGGDGAAPGRALDSGDMAPDYFSDPRFTQRRVIAQAGEYKLFAARTKSGGVEFDLGNTGVGLGMPTTESFRNHAVIVLGPGAMRNMDQDGHIPVFGVTSRSVTRVELTYASGPPLRLDDVRGAFVLLAEPPRSPQAVVGFDATGREVERRHVDTFGWSRYGPPAKFVPSVHCDPGDPGRKRVPDCPPG